jgi:hypothetical protein
MNHHYKDIRDRIAEPPQWFDENAVPRYCPFAPNETANIYAQQIVLLRIRCQNCGRPFDVCMSWCETDTILGRAVSSLEEQVRERVIHYGDPPNTECCPSGPTMNSEPDRVLQFWRHAGWRAEDGSVPASPWVRVPALEVDVEPEWVKEQA